MLNIVGTAIMFIANGWLTFMNTPNGIDELGNLTSVWDAINNYIWMPINIHRLIANMAFGGAIGAAYGAYKFLGAKTLEEKAHYDWMGYIGNFIAICALLPLPFAGYWLGVEIYAYDQSLGITLMGGTFSWLFIIQAVLIGNLFLAANFYLWLSMGRIGGAERYRKFIKYLLAVITVCFIVWATPHSLVATVEEARAMGGSHHPILNVLGVMSAKNTAVNVLISDHVRQLPVVPQIQQGCHRELGQGRKSHPVRHFCRRGHIRGLPWGLRLFCRCPDADRTLAAAGHVGALRHDFRDHH